MPSFLMRKGINAKRILSSFTLVVLAITLSGCVYLRLLNFKNQLTDFERNVTIEAPPGLSFSFNNPVVRGSDLTFVTNSKPTLTSSIATDPNIELWTWRFEKQRAEPHHKSYSVNFQTRLESGLLTNMIIDDPFVDLIGRNFILKMFHSVGDAKINTFRRSISASMDKGALDDVSCPTLAKIIDAMGKPTRTLETPNAQNQHIDCEYVFNFLNPKNQKRAGQFKLIFKADPLHPETPVTGFKITGKGR
ncbi:MAG: hypothetical protein HOI15_17900 [Opitutales bacterium]|nr:hypothetical protein [Opitutales bacterium]MBT6380938.1 hypothetical protein [Opitutales bacterium]MBT6767500.1 hypothetical protein [Opitutales bacterium]MDG2255698.1 hypothetical protein [Opitutaceae bacterium]